MDIPRLHILIPCALLALAFPWRGVILQRIFSLPSIEQLDFASLRLHDKPNQYLICPIKVCMAKPHREAPEFSCSIDQLRGRWDLMIERQRNIALLAEDVKRDQRDYVQRTRLMRYPDIITVRFYPLPEGRSTLAVYSRSVYGRSDLGANKARIDAWLDELSKP